MTEDETRELLRDLIFFFRAHVGEMVDAIRGTHPLDYGNDDTPKFMLDGMVRRIDDERDRPDHDPELDSDVTVFLLTNEPKLWVVGYRMGGCGCAFPRAVGASWGSVEVSEYLSISDELSDQWYRWAFPRG